MRSMPAIEVPPNFITIRDIETGSGWGRWDLGETVPR
jgi:hypothetical protein